MLADMARILFLRKSKVLFWLPLVALCSTSPAAADGTLELDKALNQKNYLSALRIGEELASNGNARAQYVLGTMYVQGNGVPKDIPGGVAWLEKSAQQNNPDALGLLSLLHYWGVAPNSEKVKAWVYAYKAFALGEEKISELEARTLSELTKDEIDAGALQIKEWGKKWNIELP